MRSTIHEMRNQLAVAVANVEAFIDGKIAPTQDRLDSVLRALMEVDVLIDDLLPNLPHDLPPVKRTVDVCALILSELTGIEAAANAAGIELHVDRCSQKHSDCAAFICDPGQISQLVKNVLLNAIKYTPRGGYMAVDCTHEPGVMSFSVSDDGPGVLPEERLRIFEPGVRVSAAAERPGTGAGLATVKRIVDAHGGTATVDRSEFGGARFVIRLPGDRATSADCALCALCAQPV